MTLSILSGTTNKAPKISGSINFQLQGLKKAIQLASKVETAKTDKRKYQLYQSFFRKYDCDRSTKMDMVEVRGGYKRKKGRKGGKEEGRKGGRKEGRKEGREGGENEGNKLRLAFATPRDVLETQWDATQ